MSATTTAETPMITRVPPQLELRMAQSAHASMMQSLLERPSEAGGLLLGPIGTNEITAFYFDAHAECSGARYTPDHVTLNKLLREVWIPSGIDFKGFAHSHPPCCAWLSAGDMRYIKRLLIKNDDMEVFAAPIVLPTEFQVCPFVVTREDPNRAQLAQLVLF